jgi:hypothetical protein
MDTNLDIIVDTVLDNADAFIAMDSRIQTILQWGQAELRARKGMLVDANNGELLFAEAAQDITTAVQERLTALEEEVIALYGQE